MKKENTGTRPNTHINLPEGAVIKAIKGYRNRNGQGLDITYMVGVSTCRASFTENRA